MTTAAFAGPMTAAATDPLLKRLESLPRDRAPAVIVSGHITGLAVARSLGRRNVPTVVLDRSDAGVAFASRYASVTGRVGHPLEEEAAFVERLLEIGEALPERGVLFPTNDDWLLAVLRNRAKLEAHYRFPVADLDVVERLLDKRSLYRDAERLGVPIPTTHELTDDSWEHVRDTATYPLILKPAFQRPFFDAFGEKVLRVATPAELEAQWRRTRPHPLVAQEIVPEAHAEFLSLGSYVDTRGRLAGGFVGRKLEQYPVGFGTANLVETADVPDVIERGGRILAEAKFHGVSEIEFIRDRRDGSTLLIDVNPRVWKWIGLPVAAGVDLPWLAYAEATGAPVEPAPKPASLRWVYARDYIRLKSEQCGAAPDHLSDAEWAAVLTGRYGPETGVVEAVHDAEDPLPTVRLVRNLFSTNPYYCPC